MQLLPESWITKKTTRKFTLVLTIVLSLAIVFVSSHWKLTLLDTIVSPTVVRETIEDMNVTQKNAHILITSTLDIAFPLSYGCFFAGSVLQFFPKYGIYLVFPALLATLMDLTEGIIQVLALNSIADFLEFKQYATLSKFGFFILALIITLVGLIKDRFNQNV